MRRISSIIVVLLAAQGCGVQMYTRGAPGAGVRADNTVTCGCSVATVRAQADSLKAANHGSQLVPRVGMSACDVLAAVGAPDRVSNMQSEGAAPSAMWFYE